MRKHTWRFRHWWWALVLPILILIWPYFQTGVPYTHDGENHLARFANYKVAVREGQLPPRFAPNLINHYGYPVFNYNYPLANILSLPLSILSVNYEITFKVLVTLGLVIGALGAERWLARYQFKRNIRWLAVGTFLATPFVANLIYVRGNIGELWSLALFPWLLWFTESITKRQRVFLWQSVPILVAFFLSHNVSVLFGGVLWFAYSAYKFGRDKSLWKKWLWPTILSLLMSLWFWLPALAEKNLIILDDSGLNISFARHFVEPAQLIISPLQFGFSYLTAVDSFSFSVGLVGFISLLLMSLWSIKYFKKSLEIRKWRFFIIVGWLLLFLQTAWSGKIWQTLPLVSFVQFPWRLTLFFVIFMLPLIAASASLHKRIKQLLTILFIFQLISIWRLQPADRLHKEMIDYDLFSQSTSTLNENLPRTFTFKDIGGWSAEPRVLSGEATFTVEHWTGSDRRYKMLVETESVIVEPTMYFAGWETTANQQQVSYLEPTISEGRIVYALSPGEYNIETVFTQNTWSRKVGNSISLLAIGLWAWFVWREKPHFFKRS